MSNILHQLIQQNYLFKYVFGLCPIGGNENTLFPQNLTQLMHKIRVKGKVLQKSSIQNNDI